jgi:hypothetical protein
MYFIVVVLGVRSRAELPAILEQGRSGRRDFDIATSGAQKFFDEKF